MGPGGLRSQRRDVPPRTLHPDDRARLQPPDHRRQQLTNLLVITPFAAQVFAELPAAFKDRFTVDIPDEWPATVGEVSQVARHRVAELGADTVIFGHSMNGALALATAADDAVACRGVIGVAAAQQLPANRSALEANWETNAEPRRKERAIALTAEYEAADDADKPAIFRRYDDLRRWYDIDAEPTDNYVFTQQITEWAGAVITSGAQIDWPATFAAVRVPVLLALGEYDFVVPLSSWQDAIPGPTWTVEVFERSGHSPFVEQPDEFVAAVDRWLTLI